MQPDDRPLLRLIFTGMIALGLVVAGVAIGATLWPRVVKVEQRVIAPAVKAVTRDGGLDALPDMIGTACPAVVAIAPAGGSTAGRTASGSTADAQPPLAGFLISADGDVVTTAATLPPNGDLVVLLNDGRSLAASRLGADPVSGLALLKIDGDGFPFLQFGGADFPRLGQLGIALNEPNGSGCTAQAGMVGSDSIADQAADQTYFRLAPALGDDLAGAPVIGSDGQVMGIAGLPVQSADSGNTAPTLDANAILPAGIAARITGEILRNGGLGSNVFGVLTDDLTPTLATRLGSPGQSGAVVSLVPPGSSAARAGLRAGDIVLAVGGAPISGASELARAIDGAGDQLSLLVSRRGVQRTMMLVTNRHH